MNLAKDILGWRSSFCWASLGALLLRNCIIYSWQNNFESKVIVSQPSLYLVITCESSMLGCCIRVWGSDTASTTVSITVTATLKIYFEVLNLTLWVSSRGGVRTGQGMQSQKALAKLLICLIRSQHAVDVFSQILLDDVVKCGWISRTSRSVSLPKTLTMEVWSTPLISEQSADQHHRLHALLQRPRMAGDIRFGKDCCACSFQKLI